MLVAEKSKELYERTIETGSFRGRWNKKMARETANNMGSDFQTLFYSYLDPEDLVNAPEMDYLEEKIADVVKYLGGEDWAHIFLNQTPKEEKEKVEENVAKVKFFVRTISNLRNRIKLGPILDPVIAIDIIVGEVMSVSKHHNNDKLLICNVNIGKSAIKVVTNDLNLKETSRVGIAMLPPAVFSGVTSEGMFLGTDDGIMDNVEGELGEMPKGIPIESLNESRNLVENFLKK